MKDKKESPKPVTPFRRRIILIKRGLQMKVVLLIFATVVLTSLIVALDVYYVLGKLMLQQFGESGVGPLMKAATKLLAMHLSLYFLVIFVSSIFVSHSFAGPIFRLERVSEAIAQGDLTVKVVFRAGDEFFETAEYMNRMIASLREKTLKDKNLSARVHEKLDDISRRLASHELSAKDAVPLINEISMEVAHIASDFKL